MGTWCTGTTMLICLAALQDVPNSYYEAAEIDGANAFDKFSGLRCRVWRRFWCTRGF